MTGILTVKLNVILKVACFSLSVCIRNINVQYFVLPLLTCQGKAISFQACTGPEVSRKLMFPDLKTIGTRRW
jgi:hypothetical protein